MNEIELFKNILQRKSKGFPPGFWNNLNDEKTKNIITYLINDELKWSKEDVKNRFSRQLLKNYYLTGLLKHYNGNINYIIGLIYDDIKIEDKKNNSKTWNKF